MPVLHVRSDVSPHHKRNLHVKVVDNVSELYIEFSHIGVLATAETVEDVIALYIVGKKEEKFQAPSLSESELKELIKDTLLAWGVLGTKRQITDFALNDDELKELFNLAANAAQETVPELYGLERKPRVKEEKEDEPKRNPGDPYTVEDLISMSRPTMLAELEHRKVEIPEGASSSWARKTLLNLLRSEKKEEVPA